MNARNRLIVVVGLALPLLFASLLAAEERVPWPQLSTIAHGIGWIDIERRERIDILVTVWKDCSLGPCVDEAFVHWVKPRADRSLEYLATRGVSEVNSRSGVSVVTLTYETKSEFPGHFVFDLSGPSGKSGKMRLWPGKLGEYTIHYDE